MRTRKPRAISPSRYDNDVQRLSQWVRSGAYKQAFALAEQAGKIELDRRLKELKERSLLQAQPDRFLDLP